MFVICPTPLLLGSVYVWQPTFLRYAALSTLFNHPSCDYNHHLNLLFDSRMSKIKHTPITPSPSNDFFCFFKILAPQHNWIFFLLSFESGINVEHGVKKLTKF